MANTRTWTLKIRGDSGDAIRAADKVERRYKNLDINKGLSGKMDRLRSKFGKTADSLASSGRRIAKAMAIGVAGGVAALVALSAGATKAASDLNESINATKVVFGPAIKRIRDFGRISAESVGLSTRAFNEMATPLGAMLSNAGFGADQAARSTINLTKRAADMASVFNTDVSDAMTAIQAAMRGEADPIERYGVNMSSVAVQAEAAAMGINKSWNEMTSQQKAAARLSLFMKQTQRVAGDFANTAGEVANQERIAKAKGEELAAMFGQKLIPIKAKAISIALSLMKNLGRLGGAFKSAFSGEGVTSDGLVGFMERLGVIARAVWPHLQRIGRVIKDVGLRIGEFFKDNPKVLFATLAGVIGTLLVGAVLALGAAAVAVVSPFALVVVAVGAIAGAVTYAYTRWSWFRDAVDKVVTWFKSTALPRLVEFAQMVREGFGRVVEWVRSNWPKVQEAVATVVEWFKGTAWPALRDFAAQVQEKFQGFIAWVKQVWPQVSEAIGHVLKVVMVIVGAFVVTALALWRTFGDTILTFARNAWDAIWRVIQGVLQVIRGVIQTVLALINGDWGKAWDGILLILSGVWGVIRGTIELGLAAVLGVLSLGLDALQGVWNLVWAGMSAGLGAIWRGITNGVRAGVNAVIGVVNWFIRLINKIPGVDIPEIGKVGSGGGSPDVRSGAQEHGNRRARGGFMTNQGGRGGEYVVGEGNRFRPEAVIATDPRYRRKNLGLWAWAGQQLGAPGFERGGVPGFAMGGIPNPIEGIKNAAGAVADWGRDLSVKALGPIRDTARSMIGAIPGGDRTKFIRDMGRGVIDKMYDWARGKTEEHEVSAAAGANANYAGGGVERWRSTALRALAMTGSPASWIGSLLRRMNQESGGNPRAVNLWDSNARRGDPSGGLMQNIRSAYHSRVAGFPSLRNTDFLNPLGSIVASIVYTKGRYGSGPAGWDRAGGYRNGGIVDRPGPTHPGEMVLRQGDQRQLLRLVRHRGGGSGSGGTVHIGTLVVQASTPAEGRRAGKAFLGVLAEHQIMADARIS